MSLPLPKTLLQQAWNLATQIAEIGSDLNRVLGIMNSGKIDFLTLDDVTLLKIQIEQYNRLRDSLKALVAQLP